MWRGSRTAVSRGHRRFGAPGRPKLHPLFVERTLHTARAGVYSGKNPPRRYTLPEHNLEAEGLIRFLPGVEAEEMIKGMIRLAVAQSGEEGRHDFGRCIKGQQKERSGAVDG
jgi:hypothetical protein